VKLDAPFKAFYSLRWYKITYLFLRVRPTPKGDGLSALITVSVDSCLRLKSATRVLTQVHSVQR
jgi:hypothetical protein